MSGNYSNNESVNNAEDRNGRINWYQRLLFICIDVTLWNITELLIK